MKIFQSRQSNSDLNPLFSVLILFALMIGFFYLAQYIYKFLFYISPLVILVTLLIDYRVFISYGKLLAAFTKQNLVVGVSFIVLSALMFPVICLFLLGKAILKRKIINFEQKIKKEEETFTSYEEVEDEPVINVAKKDNDRKFNYDKLFEDA
jgi:hypothetical protein